jgi:putative restriction endonuclease
MVVRAYIGVTDGDWYRFLFAQPSLDEVNFWRPGGSGTFRALSPGEPFLFKLHAPHNFIVGGGFFATYSVLPCSIAWEAFGTKNGTASFAEMRSRIAHYRRVREDTREDYRIGCVVLEEPFFLDREHWVPAPDDFSRNIVQGKGYDLSTPAGQAFWQAVMVGYQGRRLGRVAEAPVSMYGDPILMRPRLGQGGFRVLVTDTYDRRCAVTREKALPVLEAAHIQPVSDGGIHQVENGILLRSDVHTLFDRGYVTVSPDYRLRVSGRLKTEFDNGDHYYQLAGQSIWVPDDSRLRPDRRALEWHADTVFLG